MLQYLRLEEGSHWGRSSVNTVIAQVSLLLTPTPSYNTILTFSCRWHVTVLRSCVREKLNMLLIYYK